MMSSRRLVATASLAAVFVGLGVSASLGAFDGPSAVPSGFHEGQASAQASPRGGITSVSSTVMAGYRAFRRPADPADVGLLSDPRVLQGLAAGQKQFDANPSLARKVYAGVEGTAYLVPSRDRLCLAIVGVSSPTSVQCLHQDVAMQHGMGAVLDTNGVKTFIGVLPDSIRSAYIIDKGGKRHDIRLGPDNGYWTSVSQPAQIALTSADGSVRTGPASVGIGEGQPPPPPA